MTEKVTELLVSKLNIANYKIKADSTVIEDLGADSLDTVELILDFEKEFKVSIPDDQTENIQTVGDAIKYIEEHIA